MGACKSLPRDVDQRRTFTGPNFANKLLKQKEKERVFRDLFGVQY
jgi:hypothetical protein